jgi:small-conductance mechanosensitive channel
LRSRHPLLTTLLLLLLLAPLPGTLVWAQESPAPAAEASAEAIETVIATLEDADSREALVEDLTVLLEARRASAEKSSPNSADLMQWVQEQALALWDRALAVDPVQLATSLGLSLGVLLGAVIVRALLMRLAARLYARLYAGGKPLAGEEGQGEQEGSTGDTAAQAAAKAGEASGGEPPTPEHGDAVQDADAARPAALPVTVPRTINLLVVVTALVLLAGSWGADLAAIFSSDTGARLIGMVLSIGVVLVATTLLWHASDPLVRRLLRLYADSAEDQRRERRVSTLVPLIGTVLRIALGTIATLLILSELGINIGPLLAGAGILGLAVGFGAQTLVRDLITGVIILMEDSASAGDIVEVGNHIGVVEEMRIRVMQLRDLQGVVHIIPYSEVTSIKNHTMEFSCYVFDVGVAYRENTDEVIDVLARLGSEFQKERPYRDYILGPLEIFGVDALADSAVVVRARFRTVPGQQWTVGRAFNARIKQRFDELDIEIPFPHTTLYFGAPKEGAAPPLPAAQREALLTGGASPNE